MSKETLCLCSFMISLIVQMRKCFAALLDQKEKKKGKVFPLTYIVMQFLLIDPKFVPGRVHGHLTSRSSKWLL